jgi:uncharacterized protein
MIFLMKRYLTTQITEDLSKKMVFIGGPRQVGKTTLAKNIAETTSVSTYLNWDNRDHKRDILNSVFKGGSKLVIYNEIHKHRDWKNHLKGVFDTRRQDFSILVTGSARLDLYQKGGDSLLGRYFYYRLHPLSIAELMGSQYDRTLGLVFAEEVQLNYARTWCDRLHNGATGYWSTLVMS